MNALITVLAGLIPMALGMLWYSPKVFGRVWQRASGLSDENLKQGKMAVIFGVSIVMSMLLAVEMNLITIHQFHLKSLYLAQPGFADGQGEAFSTYTALMETLANRHRSFGHGAFHGTLAAVLFAIPILTINALFERKGMKYILVNAGYWLLSLVLMGGVICQFT